MGKPLTSRRRKVHNVSTYVDTASPGSDVLPPPSLSNKSAAARHAEKILKTIRLWPGFGSGRVFAKSRRRRVANESSKTCLRIVGEKIINTRPCAHAGARARRTAPICLRVDPRIRRRARPRHRRRASARRI